MIVRQEVSKQYVPDAVKYRRIASILTGILVSNRQGTKQWITAGEARTAWQQFVNEPSPETLGEARHRVIRLIQTTTKINDAMDVADLLMYFEAVRDDYFTHRALSVTFTKEKNT